MAFQDITGKRFGRLVTKEYLGHSRWLCQCDCGNEKSVATGQLNRGTKSCGCYRQDKTRQSRMIDLTGKRFERLIVIKRLEQNKHRKFLWECKCDCGKTIIVTTGSLTSGNTKSCGCYCKDRTRETKTTHGLSMTKAYYTIRNARRRQYLNKTKSDWSYEMEETLRILFPSCALCGTTNEQHLALHNERLHVDHVKPLSKGNGIKPGNAVLLCRECNCKKYTKPLEKLSKRDALKLRCDALLFKRIWEVKAG
jgi:hypothetical protein